MQDSSVKLYGASYSVYVRICRMVLGAKGIEYELVPVDVFAEGGPGKEHLDRHPFGKIPAFQHGDFSVFETDAIVSYADMAFDGPPLQFGDTRQHARMRQLMRIVDNYVYPVLVWKCYVPETTDGQQVAPESWRKADNVLAIVSGLMGPVWMVGDEFSLADIYMWAALAYFRMTGKGHDLVAKHNNLEAWCDRMAEHPVSVQTRYDGEP